MTRIFISTGEVSGDLQGALLIAALRRQAQQLGIPLEIAALGGDRMAAAGVDPVGENPATLAPLDSWNPSPICCQP
ncbi:hypothetical protein [Neosynechococcus sphagnicola]|uniref:hypothetical protein n=1 Tax=Neosynechococcus sphagnicola TaxID=1501145 RepID=UPI000B321DA9|nr:hypothetical protein [Neosynechococcus sphagnicola]